jgi:SAM-dependent methyltransferase
MTSKEAIALTVKKFPFKEYMTPWLANGVYQEIVNVALRYLKPRDRILDFGCGPCDKTSILHFLGFVCSGYDDLQDDWHRVPGNKAKIMSFAKESGIKLKIAKGGKLPFEKKSFDMVMMHDVLEHLHDSPRDLLNNLLALVKPEGLLFITVPSAVNIRKRIDVFFGRTNLSRFEGYYWYPGSWRGHTREYVRDDLVKLSEYLNLEVLELRSFDQMLHRLPSLARWPYRLITIIFPGWKDSWLLVARKKRGWVPNKTITRNQLNRILERTNPYKYSN